MRPAAERLSEGRTSAAAVRFASGSAEEAFAGLQVYQRQFSDLVGSVRSGLLTAEGATRSAEALMARSYEQAYRQGLASLGVERFTDFDRKYLAAAVRNETRFASTLFRDVATGQGVLPYGERAAFYGRGYDAMYQVGQVQALPWETDIYWTLGAADHCQDCVALEAANPYSKATIPIVPGAGGTQCLFNCACTLRFEQRPAREERMEVPSGLRQAIDVAAGPVPEGLRLPTPDELDEIREMWGSIQYHRTAVRFADPSVKGLHVAARRDANEALISYLDRKGIHWTRGMGDDLFNPPPGGGVGGGFPRGGRTGIASEGGRTIVGAGVPTADPSLFRVAVRDLGEPDGG